MTSPKAHKRHEALEFVACTAELLPPEVTGDDLRIAAEDEIIRQRLAAAYAEILSPRMIFGATEARACHAVAQMVIVSADAHMRDHVRATKRP